MPQSIIVIIIIIEAIAAYCFDAYIIVNKMPVTTHPNNPLTSSSNPLIEGLLILLLVRFLLYFFLAILSKKDGVANLVLLIGSIFITVIGIFIESDSTSNGWQFISIPIQFVALLILWPVVALTHHSSGTPNGAP